MKVSLAAKLPGSHYGRVASIKSVSGENNLIRITTAHGEEKKNQYVEIPSDVVLSEGDIVLIAGILGTVIRLGSDQEYRKGSLNTPNLDHLLPRWDGN
jgi:hypothetical protein